MSEVSVEDRQKLLEQSAMRARLYARDGINRDLVDAGQLALKAMLPAADAKRALSIPKRMGDLTGKRIGGSVVGACVGRDPRQNNARIYDVSCAGCGRSQFRSSSLLGWKLRHGGSVECPGCVTERARGRQAEREEAFRERARQGGPVYTVFEVMALQESVRAALIEKFGEPYDPDDFMPVPLHVAVGWPYSANDEVNHAWRTIEKNELERAKQRAYYERRVEKQRAEVGRDAVRLLEVMATGDTRAMFDVLREVES